MRRFLSMAMVRGLAGIALLGSHVAAQAPSASAVERKNKVPFSADVLRVKLPAVTETKLSNGLTVLILEDQRLPLVSVRYDIVGAGALFEPPGQPGLATMTALMMREGTRELTSVQIADELARLGASINVSAAFGSSEAVLTASGLSDNFPDWFNLANELLLHSCFPPNELARLKQRTLVNLRQQRTDPGFLANERFRTVLYGSHPGAVVSTNAEAVAKFTNQMLVEWHRERFTPQNTILSVVGKVKTSEVLRRIEKALEDWKQTDLQESLPPAPQAPSRPTVHLVDRPGSVQTTLYLGNIALDRRDPDYIPLVVANRLLGGGASARLFLNLREEKGYTYGAYSQFQASKYPGPWRAYADVRTEVTEGAMTEFTREIRRMSEQPVPQTELAEVQRSIVGSFALSLEDKDTLLGYAVTRKIYGLPDNYWETYPEKVMAVTPADIQRVAGRYMNPATLQIVAVGDSARIRDILARYGAVETYSVDRAKAP